MHFNAHTMSTSLSTGSYGTPTSFSGQTQSPCYKIKESMFMCFAANRDGRMCEEEVEDYFECLHRKKERLYWSRISARILERREEYQRAMGTYQPSNYEMFREKVFGYVRDREEY
mmetsp:Transcript_11046/g.41192  ORF Transcript_11046/g.41192 Transcript_11046/m.41192 type:complete len:115 (-) Transcript_11046:5741-6085(-)